ncbi:MAG: alpha-E domain-containing protein [Myxococcota bacterium]
MMLSRIARGLYELGRSIERSQNVVRILEVNHKMNLERAAIDESNAWLAISESFACELDRPDERSLYDSLVLSETHPHSVRRCIQDARDEGRAMREHISEEMWLHLNRTFLDLADLSFASILRIGRSQFNQRIEVFADGFHGLADDTMIRGESWAFLRIGKFLERASMIGRILEIKRKALSLAPDTEGAPIDIHQWQALLRSLSGYEPYRRAYDARIVPERVLAFVLRRDDFPRSLTCTLRDLERALDVVAGSNPAQIRLAQELRRTLEDLHHLDTAELIAGGSFESELLHLRRRCHTMEECMELGYFTSLRPASTPIAAAPGAALVPQ